ncbi:zinc finger protein 546-like [Eupeodes corollae]|uniref:zinc finger protein 546-like n=1 Tax=Eupeodes corollae TaxID=290404 RepID=UPI002490F058|nr:zinc finger protein 546-like [Eupeodes corollae]
MECSTMCRVCMQNISLEYVDLDTPFHDTTYFECFNYCTKLEAKASDKLPKSICVSCANLLQNSYDFITAAAEADRMFREYIVRLDDNDDHTKFEAEHKTVAKELLNVSAEFEIIVLENKPTIHLDQEKYEESMEDTGTIRDISPKDEIDEIINEEEDYRAEFVDTEQDWEINIENAPIAAEDPIFEVVESNEVRKLENNVLKIIEKQKQIKPALRYILPKIETENNEDAINTKLETKDILSLSGNLILNQQNDTSINKCDICKKKIRKNFADHMNQHTGNRAYKCDKCDDSFYTLKQYTLHKAQEHKRFRDAWFCNNCGEAFETRSKLINHRNNYHNEQTSGLCLACGENLSDEEALQQHVKDKHWSRKLPVECSHCKKKYQLNTLPMHVKYAHSDVARAAVDKVFTCKYCFKNCEDPIQLEKHVKNHKAKHLYSCVICGNDFKGKAVFEKHKAEMHPMQNVNSKIKKCNRCEFTTTQQSLLVKHRKKKHYNYYHNRIRKFLCAYCPKKFLTLKTLNDHEDYQHGEQKTAHQCDLCGKKFDTNFKLQLHKKSAHENERPYMCKECPKAFKLKSQLLQHEKNHYERKINCPYCDKKYVQPAYLRVHLRTHTNELPYECHLCDKKFPIKGRLTYHLAKHEGSVRKCEYCPETFANVAKLRIHRFEHIGYPLVCDICKENHYKRESLVRHMKRYHQIVMTKEDVEENRLRNMKNFYRKPKVKAESNLEISERKVGCPIPMDGLCWRRFEGGNSLLLSRVTEPPTDDGGGGAGGINACCGPDGGNDVTVASGNKGCLGCGRARDEADDELAAAALWAFKNNNFNMNFDQSACRVCLLADSIGFPLAQKADLSKDYTFLEMFNACTHLEALESDEFPQFICQSCSQDLQITFDFLYKASISDQFLKDQLKISKKDENCDNSDENNESKNDHTTEENSLDCEEYSQVEHPDEFTIISQYEDGTPLEQVKCEQSTDNESVDRKDGFGLEFEQFVKVELASEKIYVEYNEDSCQESNASISETILDTEGEKKESQALEVKMSSDRKTSANSRDDKDVENGQYVECKICGKFLKQMSMKHHLKRCQQEEKLHLCSSCPKSFAVRSDLKNHMRTHDKERERRFVCSECGKGFFEKQSLKVHIARHMGDKEYHCSICPKQFTTKKSLDVHVFTHNRDLGRFVCKHCDKRFPSRADLTVHERFHTGDYPFQCELCDKSYAVKSHYNYHLAKHKGITYKCDQCDKEFLNRGSLTAHKFKHNERMPHECSICKKGFASPYKLNRHKSCHKPKEDDDRIK